MARMPKSKCVFCLIVSRQPGMTAVLAESASCVAFSPRTPDAKEHVLVVPKKHLTSARSLGPEHVTLLEDMRKLGLEALHVQATVISIPPRLVFHVPPFNSINHLHLHVLRPPFAGWYENIKFTSGFPWCTSYHSVMSKLQGQTHKRTKLVASL